MTAPTKAPPSTGGEYVCVPREPTVEQVQIGRGRTAIFGIGAVYKAMLAAAPATHVPVPRELCERLLGDSDVYPKALFELRALLSPAPKDEAK